jgi:hypothetical protein
MKLPITTLRAERVGERPYAIRSHSTADRTRVTRNNRWKQKWSKFGRGLFPRAHPRAYGTFPHILRKYVREDHLLTLPDAIRKFTALPAQTMHLADRGVLKAGMWADIVIFDPDKIADLATYANPNQYSAGTEYPRSIQHFSSAVIVFCVRPDGIRDVRSSGFTGSTRVSLGMHHNKYAFAEALAA